MLETVTEMMSRDERARIQNPLRPTSQSSKRRGYQDPDTPRERLAPHPVMGKAHLENYGAPRMIYLRLFLLMGS